MIPRRKKLIELAETATRESKYLDFKQQFETTSNEAWCEIIKDIIAMANSGGGIIVLGIDDDGADAEMDRGPVLEFDTAEIATKISKYTNHQFEEIEVMEVKRSGKIYAAFLVSAADIPVVFTKPGTYEVADKKQKTAFGQGTIYFRHGSKSEHGNRNDLSKWRDREIEKARKTWMGNIRKVVETDPGESVTIVSSPGMSPKFGSMVQAAITSDPSAIKFSPTNAAEIWPHRRSDIVSQFNSRVGDGDKISGYDIVCLNTVFDMFNTHPEFAHKSHATAGPQYSNDYVDWLSSEYRKNKNFFSKVRQDYAAGHVQKRKRRR